MYFSFVSTWWTTHRDNPVGAGELLKIVQDIESFELAGDDDHAKVIRGHRKL